MTDNFIVRAEDLGDNVVQIKPPEFALQINDRHGIPSVAIRWDGTVELAPGVTADKASRDFWEAVVNMLPSMRDVVDFTQREGDQ